MRAFLLHYRTALLLLAGVVIRDLWCWAAAKVFCWRKRRQTQRAFQQEREHIEQRIDPAIAALAKLPPVVLQPHIFITPTGDFICLVLLEDKRRFAVCEISEKVN